MSSLTTDVHGLVGQLCLEFRSLHDLRRRASELQVMVHHLRDPHVSISSMCTLHRFLLDQLSAGCTVEDAEIRQRLQSLQASLSEQPDAKLTSLRGNEAVLHLTATNAAAHRVEALLDQQQLKRRTVLEQLLQRFNVGSAALNQLLLDEVCSLEKRSSLWELIFSVQELHIDGNGAAEPLLDRLCSVVANQPDIAHVDLSGCLLGTERACDIVTELACEGRMVQTINLSTNCLRTPFVDCVERLLAERTKFLHIRRILIGDNEGLDRRMQEVVDEMVFDKAYANRKMIRQSDEWMESFQFARDAGRKVSVLTLDGFGMKCAIQPRALMNLQNGPDEQVARRFDVIAASSFATITAAAIAVGLPLDRVEKFFARLATELFAHGRYVGYYASCGTRSIRSWWTGGDYYSSKFFREALKDLFGQVGMQTLAEAQRLKGIKLILCCQVAGSDASVRVFRSYQSQRKHPISPLPANKVLLIDAVQACCATPGLFAPFQLFNHDGGSKTPLCALQDAMMNPTSLALSECLEHFSICEVDFLSLGCGARSGLDEMLVRNYLTGLLIAKAVSRMSTSTSATSVTSEWEAAIMSNAIHRTVTALFHNLPPSTGKYQRTTLNVAKSGFEISLAEENEVLLLAAMSNEVVEHAMEDLIGDTGVHAA